MDTKKFLARLIAAAMGGAKVNGFVAATPMPKAKSKGRQFDPKDPGELDTQAQGRAFAVRFLETLESMSDRDQIFSANARMPDEDEPSGELVRREGPQSDLIRRTFDAVYAADEEARRGFFQIITDQLGTAPSGWYDPKEYRKLEAGGYIQDDPAASSKPAEAVELYDRLQAEREPILGDGEAEAIEKFLRRNGIWRRMALAFLSRTWNETADPVRTERESALAFAAVFHALEETAGNYKRIAELMESAKARLMVALATREDMAQILAEAKSESAQGQKQKQDPSAQLLGTQKDGRKLAIDFLKAIMKWASEAEEIEPGVPSAPFALLPHDPTGPAVGEKWRTRPQSPAIRHFFDMVYRCDLPVRIGFFAVLSDWLGQEAAHGDIYTESYEEWEEAGAIKDVEQGAPDGENLH